ncbi:Mu transposase C-terminal domain-containing protein [Herbaspirillum sp. NPDC101396]|uniref:Mu transposase C-terminal domain-containing protein n=1 Tax=Herbaspirillum sp. NPDC101396 TaxID=3364005 RepID=UPI003839E1D5
MTISLTAGALLRGLSSNDFSFSPGQKFERDLTVFMIVERREAHCVIENFRSLEKKLIAMDQLYQMYLSQEIIPLREAPADMHLSEIQIHENTFKKQQIESQSSAAIKHGISVSYFIKALRALGHANLRPTPLLALDYAKISDAVIKSEATLDITIPSLDTIYRWSRKLDAVDGDMRVVIPNFAKRGGPGRRRISTEAMNALENIWNRIRNDPESKIRFFEIEKDLKKQLLSTGNQTHIFTMMPSRSTIERLTRREFGNYTICFRNHGARYAKKIFHSWFPRDRAQSPLEVVEFDDKDTRVFLIDDRSGLPYGRAFVTSGVDQYSAVPLGLSIGDKHRSTVSALDAFRRAILPKSLSDIEFAHLKNSPEFFGICSVAIFDNALYNHSKAIERATLESSGSISAWATPDTGSEKSIVEDFNNRMSSGLFAETPGFIGTKRSLDGEQHALASANMSLQVFKQRLQKWAYEIYCNTPRDGGLTPRQIWHSEMRHVHQRLPSNLDQFDFIFTVEHSVRLRPSGLEFTGLCYQSQELIELQRSCGSKFKVTFRFHPNVLSRVFILDPRSKTYFIVNSTTPNYTNALTLSQHKLIRKMTRDRGLRNPAIIQLLDAREELRLLTSQAGMSKNRKDRRWANTIGPIPASGGSSDEPIGEHEFVSELEYQINQISQIELGKLDDAWDFPEDF